MKYCSNCGHELADGANFCNECGTRVLGGPGMEVTGQPEVYTIKYITQCYHCGAEIKYSDGNIHRNPVANRAVSRHGFKGYIGEIRCPSCGTWLPHYSENTI